LLPYLRRIRAKRLPIFGDDATDQSRQRTWTNVNNIVLTAA
jgi:hypothetical protein